jgi:class 3 adenylate cyclase
MRQDEAATVATLKDCREAMASLIKHYSGRVVDSPGDNILAEFGSVVDAVECAVEIQKKLKNKNEELPDDRKMDFRIGIMATGFMATASTLRHELRVCPRREVSASLGSYTTVSRIS